MPQHLARALPRAAQLHDARAAPSLAGLRLRCAARSNASALQCSAVPSRRSQDAAATVVYPTAPYRALALPWLCRTLPCRAKQCPNSAMLRYTSLYLYATWQHHALPLPCSAVPRQAKGHRTLPLRWLTQQSNAKLCAAPTERSTTPPAPRATLPRRHDTQHTAAPTPSHTQPSPACARHRYSPSLSLSRSLGLLAALKPSLYPMS